MIDRSSTLDHGGRFKADPMGVSDSLLSHFNLHKFFSNQAPGTCDDLEEVPRRLLSSVSNNNMIDL